ncbi:MAG TPA: hypothetical protein DEV72_18365 [Ktedonobacter sp.]|jgi:hypothetical protein|nr:hypothetical protein [Ktedonobacter sp.]
MAEPVGRDGRDGRDETVRIMNRCASRGEADGFIIDGFMRDRQSLQGLLLISSHFIDLPERVRFPAAEAGRKA